MAKIIAVSVVIVLALCALAGCGKADDSGRVAALEDRLKQQEAELAQLRSDCDGNKERVDAVGGTLQEQAEAVKRVAGVLEGTVSIPQLKVTTVVAENYRLEDATGDYRGGLSAAGPYFHLTRDGQSADISITTQRDVEAWNVKKREQNLDGELTAGASLVLQGTCSNVMLCGQRPELWIMPDVHLSRTGLTFTDLGGLAKAWLQRDSEGSGLALCDGNGEVRADVTTTKEGPRLALWDENSQMRAGLLGFKNDSSLNLYDEKGKACAGMGVQNGALGMAIFDDNGTRRVGMGMVGESPSLMLLDANGKARTVLGCTDLVNTATGAKTKTGESSLVLFGTDGNVIFQSP